MLPGRTTPKVMREIPPSTVPGSEDFESYQGAGGIYVVRYASLVLPCYVRHPRLIAIHISSHNESSQMIEFERIGYGAGYGGQFLGLGAAARGPIMPGLMPMPVPAPYLPPFRAVGPPAGVPLYPPGYAVPMPIPRPLAPAPRSRKGKGRLR